MLQRSPVPCTVRTGQYNSLASLATITHWLSHPDDDEFASDVGDKPKLAGDGDAPWLKAVGVRVDGASWVTVLQTAMVLVNKSPMLSVMVAYS